MSSVVGSDIDKLHVMFLKVRDTEKPGFYDDIISLTHIGNSIVGIRLF